MGAAPEGENPLQLPKKLQVVVEVPKNVRPGVTKLAVDVDEESELHILVPVEAAVGDRLRISKEEGGPWTCVILKNQPLYDMTNRQLSSPGGDTGKLQLLVPATIKPGETKLQVSISDSEQVQLSVPENASPGDLVELVRSAETWTAKFTRDRYSVASDPKNNLAVMADLAKTSSQAGLDAEAAAENLIAVAKEAGCFVSPKIKRGCVPPLNIPGLVAVEAIEEGEELIRVPSKFHITPPAVERAAPVLAEAAKASSLPEQRRLEALHAFFVARLLADSQERAVSSEKASNSNAFNRWTATEDQKKVWEAYADTLLTEDFSYHPFRLAACSPEEMRGHLSPSQEAEYYIDMASDLMSLHDTMLRIAWLVLEDIG
ncbi:unnamed protein product [Cladocopium goreaui]|uniref:Uncharacterized protein n=1 Tax=Cladocopium goreaui TaxID=2562237 RepID=A0A9P1DDT6_9DINO|nr:unnamed protein product [Cladocopium goreaui]